MDIYNLIKKCNIVVTIISACILLGFLFNRYLFRQILNISLISLTPSNHSFIVCVWIYSFVMLLVTMITCYLIFRAQTKTPFKWPIKQFILNSLGYLSNILPRAYNMLITYLGFTYKLYLLYLIRKSLSWRKYYKKIIIFVEFTRISILITFISEIFIEQLHYYFITLFLLLFPLMLRFFIFILEDASVRLLPEISECLEFSAEKTNTTNIPNAKFLSISFKPEHQDNNLNHYLYNFYYPVTFIGPEIQKILPFYKKVRYSILIIYYITHFLGWSYILYNY